MTTDEALFEQAVGRMRASMLWLSGGGALAAWLLAGGRVASASWPAAWRPGGISIGSIS